MHHRRETVLTIAVDVFGQPQQGVHLSIDHGEKRSHSNVGLIGMLDGRSEFVSNVPVGFEILRFSTVHSQRVRMIEFPHVFNDRVDGIGVVRRYEHQTRESFDELW